MRLNAMVAGELAAATAARGVFLVYISTDYVFAGRRGEAPYATTATPAPTNVYGQTKLAGEKAVLEASSRAAAASAGSPAVRSVVLRVPVLYGTGEVEESAVNTLVAQVWAAQKVTDPTKKIPVDAYAQRFPTNTSDVARVCRDVCTRYLANADEALPTVLHFSSEDRMTKWDMVRTFGEMLALPTDNLEPHVPAQGDDTSATATSRPYDTHLDTSVLQHLGIAVHTADFRAWWFVDGTETLPTADMGAGDASLAPFVTRRWPAPGTGCEPREMQEDSTAGARGRRSGVEDRRTMDDQDDRRSRIATSNK